jgi:hypothetical protein
MIATTNSSIDFPTKPGMDYQISGIGTWNGATVTLYTYSDDAWRAVPSGAWTADFEIVRTNGDGTQARLTITSAGGSTSLALNCTEVPKI